MNKQSFLHGAMVLVVASLVTKVLSMAMKMILARYLGPEGIGLFKMVFPLLVMVLTLSTAGLPIAISKLVAEAVIVGDIRKVKRIMKVTTTVITSLSVILTIATLTLAPWLTQHIMTDPRTYYTVLAMSPAILIISWSSILRGYFQGIQNQTPPSMAWVFETFVRTLITLPLVFAYMPDLAKSSAAAMVGVLGGELAYLGYLYWQYVRKYKYTKIPVTLQSTTDKNAPRPESYAKTLSSLAQIAIPVTFSGIIGSLAYGLEPILVTKSLVVAGYGKEMATALYGLYSGMAVEILVWPTVFTYSLAVTLVPAVSEALAVNQMHVVRRRLYQAFRFTAMIGLPASVLFTLLANQLTTALYNQPDAGPLLAMLAPIGFLIYLKSPLSGILQGMNRAGLAMAVSIVGSAIKLGLIWWLASKPAYGLTGVIWAVIVSNVFTAFVYFWLVIRITGFYVQVADTCKILLATFVMSLILLQTKTITASLDVFLQVMICTTISIFVYVMLLFILKALTLDTIRRVPKIGSGLASILRFIPFVR